MAKPEHTAYQVFADFSALNKIAPVSHPEPVALSPKSIHWDRGFAKLGARQRLPAIRYGSEPFNFVSAEEGFVSFGLNEAEELIKQCREVAKTEFEKGTRPAFFLRKLSMSEFIAHKNFAAYKDHSIVGRVFKKYLLMDLLREKGYQMS